MKALFVTGRQAYPIVNRYAGKDVHVCKMDVAALLSPRAIISELSKIDLNGISLIVVPGYVRGDVSTIEKELGIRCVKGPKNAADIPTILTKNSFDRLSSKSPADDVLGITKDVQTQLDKAFKSRNGLKIGKAHPTFLGTIIKVIAEIPEAPLLKRKDLADIVVHYTKSGANILDIGMVQGQDNADKISDIVQIIKKHSDLPIALDSGNKKEILAGNEAGVDLILSIDELNKNLLGAINVPVVLVPRNKNGVPKNPSSRVRLLEKLVRAAKGRCKVIVDPLLQPVNTGFVESLSAYILFRRTHPHIPMMMGAGNITELMDADSIGINALLAAIASELNIELIFTTQASQKTKGAVWELAQCVRMMYLSASEGHPPKDVGIDMLFLKDKIAHKITPVSELRPHPVKAGSSKMDAVGIKIYLDGKDIVAVCYNYNEPLFALKADNAKAIYQQICTQNLIGCEHAAYLGKELAKAEIALGLGKNYIQDDELFNKSYNLK